MVREKTSIRLIGWGSFREAFVSSRGIVARRLVLAVLAMGCSALTGLAFASAPALAEVCPNEQFRQGLSAALPDCRAYEMVSPPNKNGGEVDSGLRFGEVTLPEQAAADGEAVTYGSSTTFLETGADSAELGSQYLSKRTPSGWQTQAITPRQEIPEGDLKPGSGEPEWSLYQGFNENLSSAFLTAWNPQPVASAPEGFFNPYLRDDENGEYQLLSSVTPQMWPPGPVQLFGRGYGVVYAGMSTDGQHVIFEANEALTPEAVPGRDNLYEWSVGRALELVSVLPGGGAYAEGQEHPNHQGPLRFGMNPVNGVGDSEAGFGYSYSGALSSDGSRAFWTGAGKVYMHEITASDARTVEVSASQKGGGGSGTGQYWTANPSGSLVYFTSTEQLTEDSNASPETPGSENDKPDLYQYNVETGVLSDLSSDDQNAGETAAVQGLLGSGESEGMPYVYFMANGVLGDGGEAGATPGNCERINHPDRQGIGSCNLYVWHGGETKFIARLGTAQAKEAGMYIVEAEEEDFTDALMDRTSRVSPDGRLLAFESVQPLTGYDNVPASGECPLPETPEQDGPEGYHFRNSEGRCVEVFEYDAQSGRLSCASCDPSALPPTGESMIPGIPHLLLKTPGWESETVQQRYLLDDGRLFFDSEDALLPGATDGKQNVYEYEPEGTGGCAASGAGSCLYLISSGTSSENSFFIDASTDGRDVFFTTRQQLVPQDGDEAVDLYDAREGGGFSVAQPPPCSGESCKPAVTPAPAIYGAPSSTTFVGAGNPVAMAPAKTKAKAKAKSVKCKKGYLKKKDRCVKRVRAKKSSKRKGSK